jgi:hypothetical protein
LAWEIRSWRGEKSWKTFGQREVLENLKEQRISELLLQNPAGGVEALEDLGGDGDVHRGPELTEM